MTFGNGGTNGVTGANKKDDDSNRPGRTKPAALRFQDASNRAMEDERRNQIKDKLIDGVKSDELESFRKSDDDLKSCKNKKLKGFYESQNSALNDWLEVDSIVRYIADDIFASFDPDRDHDGIMEGRGALQDQHEDVEAFLPQEERDARRQGERKAKWAINVRNL